MKYCLHSIIQITFLVAFAFMANLDVCIAHTISTIKFSKASPIHDSTDISFESSAMVKKLFYNRPHRLAVVGKDMNGNGAWSRLNMDYDSLKTGKWFIEQQRYATDAIVAGIVQDDGEVIERGMMALEWGMKQQQPDGSFNCPDNFHSTSFYVEAVAHACLLLNRSKYYSKYETRITQLKSCITKAVNWMLQPTILASGIKRNSPYTHRRYLVGAAIGETGVLCGNTYFINQSNQFITEGISLQDNAGFNPEKHGYDCSYHAVGLVFAHRYFDIVANEKQKLELLGMFDKGIKWLLTRIDTTGNVNGEGNTRTGFGQEKSRDGKPKNINYGSITNALLWWALYRHDKPLETLAEKVYNTGKSTANNHASAVGESNVPH